MTLPKPTFRDLLWLIVLVVLVVFLWRGCGERKTWEQKVVEKEEARKKSIDSLNKQLNEQLEGYGIIIQDWQDSVDAYQSDAEVYRYERNEAWAALGATKKEADQLIARIKESNGRDTAGCLQLAVNYSSAAQALKYYKNKSDELVAKLDTAGVYKDSIISEERSLKKHALEVGFETAQAYSALHASMKRLSPHNSVWAGFETTFSPGAILAGPTIALQTKKNTQYQLSVGLDSKDVQYYVSGKILWKISFRKK